MKKLKLLLLTSMLALTGCTQEVKLGENDTKLVATDVTQSADAVVYPDDNPSLPDGQAVWEKMNCAQCHGGAKASAEGGDKADTKASGEAAPTETSPMPNRGASVTANLSDKAAMENTKPLDQYLFLTYGKPGSDHQALKDKLSRRQIWDLVFYSRSLSTPALTDKEWEALDPVFGANCAVCHGKRGHGDGPLARNLDPVPANFHQYNRFYDRTDKQIWEHIAYGIKWTGMPEFRNKKDKTKNVTFDDAYIHKLTSYIRAFHMSTKPTVPVSISMKKGSMPQ